MNSEQLKTHARERYKNNAHRGAFIKGYNCAVAGGVLSDCPYDDSTRTSYHNSVTFARGMTNAWGAGFALGGKDKFKDMLNERLDAARMNAHFEAIGDGLS